MPDELQPSLFNILREDLRAMGERLDKLVTGEAFTTERSRVDQKFADQGADIAQERVDRELAVTGLQTQIDEAAKLARTTQETQQNRKVTLQQGLLIGLVATLSGGVITLIIAVIENASHLS